MRSESTQGIRLSPQQRHLWRLQSEGSAPAHAECVLAIEGELDGAALLTALEKVVQRHDALRLRFYLLPGMTIPLQATEDGEAELQIDFGQDKTLSAELDEVSPSRHLLSLRMPALCCDRRGLENLLREIGRSYEATLLDEQMQDEPLEYTVVAEWLNQLLESEDSVTGRDYWRQPIRAANLKARLPFETPAAAAFSPELLTTQLSEETFKGLSSLASSHGTTVEVILLACYAVLLWRLTGESPVTVGVSCDGRSDAELEGTIGLLTKFLPINSDLSDETGFANLVQQLSTATSEARDWQECFSWELFEETDLFDAGEPFFPFCFSFARRPAAEKVDGVSFSIDQQTAWVDRFNLKLACVWGEDAAQLEFHYDSALCAREDIERLAERFETLLASIIAEPATKIGKLDLLGDAGRELVLYKFNETRLDFDATKLLHHLFEQQAKRTPTGVAVLSGEQQLTYQELNERANQLAHYLQTLGIGTESLVAVSLPRSPELLLTLLAILKAGAGYLPLDPSYPSERLAFMLEDSQAALLITQGDSSAWMDQLSNMNLRVVSLETEQEAIAAQKTENALSPVTPNNLAYVIYTSGSTGRPKAVMVQHGAICNRLLWMQHEFPLSAEDRVLQKTTFSFDASIWEIFSPWLAGGCVVLAAVGGERDAAYLADAVAEHEVTVLQLVPSMLRVWVEEEAVHKCVSLRRVFSGGEALPRETSERFFDRVPGAELVNLYGPTEAAIDASFYRCREGYTGNLVPLGRPLSNMQVYLLDRQLQPVWLGVAGELYIGGVGVARGYLNQPALTAEKFIPDPFSAEPGKRLYRTGDLARRLPDGRLEFLGRIDSQVKLRGYRIELGEIESALRQHPAVQDSVVAVREDVPADQRLVAYLVSRSNQAAESNGVNLYRLPNGVEIAHLNRNETDHLYEEIFNKQNYLRHNVTLRDGDCIFDAGANIGMFTLFVNDLCRDTRIFAFEPIPTTFAALQYNIGAYRLNAKPYNCALSDRSGSANFTFYPKVSASSGMYADAFSDEQVTRAYLANQDVQLVEYADELMAGRFETESVVCPLKTISEVIRENQIEQIDLLKLDVEKSELDVLRGIADDDWPKIKQVVAEVHQIDGRLEEFSGLLKKHGFDVQIDQDASFKDTGLYHIYAIHPSRSSVHDTKGRNAGSYLHQRTLAVSGLQSYLRERLPEYMIPTAFVRLETLPKLANGKVDRKALPAPDTTRPELTDDYVAPRNSIEERIAALWAELLNLERVGIHDNFFELGGHSLLATKAISSLQEEFNVEFSLRRFFETPTVAGLAVGVVESLADPLADDQMAEILAQLETLP